jgi:hypothetical protein
MTNPGAVETLASPTLEAVCNWYGVHPKFAHAALQTFLGANYDPDIAGIQDFLNRYDRYRSQLNYTFSTNTRGQNLVQQLRKWGVPLEAGESRKSYLDVGFAYGGFLTAFAGLGYDATGIEISERFGRLGRLNVESSGYAADLLDYFRARAAYIMYTGWPEYEVSDYYEPEWYLNIARKAGVETEMVYDSSAPPADVPGEIAALYAAYSEWTRSESGSGKLTPLLRHEITLELARYSARMFREYSEHIAHNSVDRFARKWIDPLTRILIRKPAAS